MISPKASTSTDLELLEVLRRYDRVQSFTISDIDIGDSFKLKNGKYFVKGEKLRKRYKCIQLTTNKVYLFHPFAEIIKTS